MNTFAWFLTSIFSLSFMIHLSREATNTFLGFDFTQLGLEPTIFRTRGEHAYHYNNDQVIFRWKLDSKDKRCSTVPYYYLYYSFTVVTDNKYNIEPFYYNAKIQGTKTWTNFFLPCHFVSIHQHFVKCFLL
jgi:hypothetical protein